MFSEMTFATITDDHGIASELVPVSPIFTRCGPCSRGRYVDRREARTWRTDARQAVRYRDVGDSGGRVVASAVTDDTAMADGSCDFRSGRS